MATETVRARTVSFFVFMASSSGHGIRAGGSAGILHRYDQPIRETGDTLFTEKSVESPSFVYGQEITEEAIAIAGYTVATGVGIMRMYNNRHWASDVLAGAGVGILSASLMYWLAPYLTF